MATITRLPTKRTARGAQKRTGAGDARDDNRIVERRRTTPCQWSDIAVGDMAGIWAEISAATASGARFNMPASQLLLELNAVRNAAAQSEKAMLGRSDSARPVAGLGTLPENQWENPTRALARFRPPCRVIVRHPRVAARWALSIAVCTIGRAGAWLLAIYASLCDRGLGPRAVDILPHNVPVGIPGVCYFSHQIPTIDWLAAAYRHAMRQRAIDRRCPGQAVAAV